MGAALMSTLGACSGKKRVLIYATSEEERIAYVQEKLNAQFPNYEIVIEYQGTGALSSKLLGEGKSTDCDIVFELEANITEKLLKEVGDDFLYDLKDYNFAQFTEAATAYGHTKYAPECMTYGAVVYNKKVLEEKGLSAPATYEDLLKPEYKDLVYMANPNSSGTGYLFFNGVASHFADLNGGDLAEGKRLSLEYFSKLNENIKEWTSSGSAPLKAVNRGEGAIGLAMLWQCVEYKKSNPDLEYTFLDYGAPSNLYVMSVINGHQERSEVKEVFDYIFNTLNKPQVESLIPDPIYKEQTPVDPEYPTNVTATKMYGLFDPVYKQDMLDSWSKTIK